MSLSSTLTHRRIARLLLPLCAASCVLDLGKPDGGGTTGGAATSPMTSTAAEEPSTGADGTGEPTTSAAGSTTEALDGSTTASVEDSSTDAGTGGSSMGCCEEHDVPGCDAPEVEACVCENLPECCDLSWSPICINVALSGCGATCESAPVNYACTCYEPTCDGVTAPSIEFAVCSGGDAAADAAEQCVEMLSSTCEEVTCGDCECFEDERFPECA